MSDVVFSRVESEIEAASGLSGAEFGVLSRLDDLGGGLLGQGELAASLRWQKSRLSHQLTRMEKRDLIARDLHGREVDVRMRRRGRDALEAARPAHARALRTYLTKRLSSAERETLLTAFAKLSLE